MLQRNYFRACIFYVGFASTFASAAGGVTDVLTAPKAVERWTAEGLTSLRVEGVDVLFVNPKVHLHGYTKVMLKSVEVVPTLGWRQRYFTPGSTRTLNLRPMIEGTRQHAKLALANALKGAGYSMADMPSADVVELSATVDDVFLIAVHIPAGRTEYAVGHSLGSAHLIADLRDSLTGELILRVFDVANGPKPQLSPKRAGEEAEAWLRTAVDDWALLLPKALDVSNRNK